VGVCDGVGVVVGVAVGMAVGVSLGVEVGACVCVGVALVVGVGVGVTMGVALGSRVGLAAGSVVDGEGGVLSVQLETPTAMIQGISSLPRHTLRGAIVAATMLRDDCLSPPAASRWRGDVAGRQAVEELVPKASPATKRANLPFGCRNLTAPSGNHDTDFGHLGRDRPGEPHL
jgi:hypothetical protein